MSLEDESVHITVTIRWQYCTELFAKCHAITKDHATVAKFR